VQNDCKPPYWQESDRLAALRSYRILDTSPEPAFDSIVQLAARICRTPVVLISLIDDRRQWFKAEVGLGLRETPLDWSLGPPVMLQPGITVVRDMEEDASFGFSPFANGEPHLRFYAGAALTTPEGLPLGALCALDRNPRELTDDQAFALQTLAQQVMWQMGLRRNVLEQDEALDRARQIEARQALLVRELHHRVKNTLALVQALVGATGRSTGSFEEFYHAFSDRIASLARTHNLLTEDYWQTASLRDIALNELKPFAGSRFPRFMLIGPHVDLAAEIAVPLGMALYELTANAVRHGALSIPDGHVEIKWDIEETQEGRQLQLEWREHGGPSVADPGYLGFGTTLLQRVLPMQCSAEVQVEYERTGLRLRLRVPLIDRRLVPSY